MKEKASDVLNYVLEDAKKDFTITRFKGLGEMNPEQLWETTMNAETRTLLKVRLKDDAAAAEEIFLNADGRKKRGEPPQIHRGKRPRSGEFGYLDAGGGGRSCLGSGVLVVRAQYAEGFRGV